MTSAEILSQVCKEFSLDAHIKEIQSVSEAITNAERLTVSYFAVPIQVKSSFMYCDTLDMCFFITDEDKAGFSYSGYALAGDKDVQPAYGINSKLVSAFELAQKMIARMQQLIDEETGDAKRKSSSWVLTDDDTFQHRRFAGFTEGKPNFELVQINEYPDGTFKVSHGIVYLSDYTEEEINEVLATYGYDESTEPELLAEAIIEQECIEYESHNDFGSFDEAKAFIKKKYLKEEKE